MSNIFSPSGATQRCPGVPLIPHRQDLLGQPPSWLQIQIQILQIQIQTQISKQIQRCPGAPLFQPRQDLLDQLPSWLQIQIQIQMRIQIQI